jgi:hypothetical protein
LKKVLFLYADPYYLVKPIYPFGLDILAHRVREKGHEVTIEYPFLPSTSLKANLKALADRQNPDLIGLSIRNIDTCMSCEEFGDYRREAYQTFYFLPRIKMIVRYLKEIYPDKPIIAGGPALTISPEAMMDYLGLTYGIIGEGERPIQRFVEVLPDETELAKIPGMVRRRDGQPRCSPREPYEFSQDSRYIIRDPGFQYAYEAAGIPIQVKRGCNRSCSYCVEPLIEGMKPVFRDVDHVVEELKAIAEVHEAARDIFFVDTEFNVPDSEHASKLIKAILREGLNERFHFTSQFLPKPFDSRFAALLHDAGFSVVLTCDSFADTVLERNGIIHRQEDIRRTLDLCEQHRISCTVAMIFGLPGETQKTLDHSLEQMNRYAPHAFRRYEYTVGGRIYQETPLCRYIEGGGGEEHLYGNRSAGYLEPLYYCAPDSPMALKAYIEKALPHGPAYDNRYDLDRHKVLGIFYLVDNERWGEVLDRFFGIGLRAMAEAYDYVFRRLAAAARIEDARAVSLRLLHAIQESEEGTDYQAQAGLIHFYLGMLG